MHPRPQTDFIAGTPMTEDETPSFKALGACIVELCKTCRLIRTAEAARRHG